MRVPPFYTRAQGTSLIDYWHDDDECPIAKTITFAHRRPGKDGRSRCPYCARLEQPGGPPVNKL